MNKREQEEYNTLVTQLQKYAQDRAVLCAKIDALTGLLTDILIDIQCAHWHKDINAAIDAAKELK